MKKVIVSLLSVILLSACSSEKIVLNGLKVYDVSNSTCKLTNSPTETRTEIAENDYAESATLIVELDKEGIAHCTLENVKATCTVTNIYVDIAGKDDQITLVVYHNPLEVLADCFCKYDVSFKMSNLLPGNYQLKVYYAHPDKRYDETQVAYQGQLSLEKNNKVYVAFKKGVNLPEY